jgi:hypothetical protein
VSSRLGLAFLGLGIAAGFYAAWRFNLGLLWLLIIAGVFELVHELKRIARVQDREKVLRALAAALGVPAEKEAVIGRVTMVHRHLRDGVTGTFPPALLDENPYTGSFSPREWTEYFAARVEDAARKARVTRRTLLGGREHHAMSADELTLLRIPANIDREQATKDFDEHSDLFVTLRDTKDAMPTMRPAEAAAGFVAYAGLAVALAALMFAVSHVPAAEAALKVFMN